jgi:hypothetical protein
LREGRSVVVAAADRDEQIEAARRALEESGAESLDAAREKWWIGIREVEERSYPAPGEFRDVEQTFRRGFAAALNPDLRDKSYAQAAASLNKTYPADYEQEAFRRGFERGQDYYRRFLSDEPRR